MDRPYIIRSVEQLKALADPLRGQVLRAVCCTSLTVPQIAAKLGTKVTRLYHHMDLLEKANLVEVVETRQNRGTVERYYQATASHFVVDESLSRVGEDGESRSAKHAMLIDGLQSAAADARNAFDFDRHDSAPDTACLCSARLRFSDEDARAFVGRLTELLESCCSAGSGGAGAGDYELTIAFFPVRASVDAPSGETEDE